MKFSFGFKGFKLSSVPDENETNSERNYYVYEWFIKSDKRIFYIGKGTGDRYKQDKNNEFLKIKNAFDCDVRFVKKGLTEHEALTLEEELFRKRENEGHVLANIITPGATGVYQVIRPYKYMKTPFISANRVDVAYFGAEDIRYDEVKEENLLISFFKSSNPYQLMPLYVSGNPKFPSDMTDEEKDEILKTGLTIDEYRELQRKQTNEIIQSLVNEVRNYVENKGGKLYKSQNKNAKSYIVDSNMTPFSYHEYKAKGYEVYHLVDVLNFIRR